MESTKKKIVVLLIKNKVAGSGLQEQLKDKLKSDQVDLLEVTHPDYSEFANMASKDNVTVVMGFGGITSIEIVMKECKNIKWFHAFSTGCEKLTGYQPFRESSITLTVSRGASVVGLSEFTIGAMLYFSRNFRTWDRLQQQSLWQSVYSTDISRKSITIVGYGKIGSRIGRICKNAFEMRVIGVKNRVDESTYKENPEVEKFHKLSELGEACEGADFVVCVLPSSKETDKVFNMDVFKRFKKTAVFISIGRGSNVIEKDLIEALRNDYMKGAALDVFEVEPLPSTSPFYTDEEIKSKVFITCHQACASESSTIEIVKALEVNLKNYLEDKPLVEVVDKNLGY